MATVTFSQLVLKGADRSGMIPWNRALRAAEFHGLSSDFWSCYEPQEGQPIEAEGFLEWLGY